MVLSKIREGRRVHRSPTLDHPAEGWARATLEDDLGFLGLVPERHRLDHESRHDHPLTPGRFFTPDPHPTRADIA